VLVVVSASSVIDVVRPVLAALAALDLEVRRVDLGHAFRKGAAYRVIQTLLGEADAGRLERELLAFAPDVAVAFDPPVARALARARDRRVAKTPVVAVVSELAPRREWAIDADRYLVVDDDAAVALSEQGVDGARVITVGPPVSHAMALAGLEDRGTLRDSFSLPKDAPVVLVVAHELPVDTLAQVVVQLALTSQVFALFDAGADRTAAAYLRQKVPGMGLRAKLFGATEDAPRLWRAADVVVAKPTPGAVLAALAAGCAFVALEPDADDAEARALCDRGIAVSAGKVLLLSSALEPLVSDRALCASVVRMVEARRSPDAAAAIAERIQQVATEKDLVLEETFAAQREAPPEEAVKDPSAARPQAASGLEDLGDDEPVPVARPRASTPAEELSHRVRAELGAREAKVKQELDLARREAELWEARRSLAGKKGDARLEADAAREADRKRARMHLALAELRRLAGELGKAPPSAGAPGPSAVDETLAELKRKVGTEKTSLDDQLAALKERVDAEKRRGKR
jgi:UDP-N-acetylglucosamine:LPS N-acetylglucosamine transferase